MCIIDCVGLYDLTAKYLQSVIMMYCACQLSINAKMPPSMQLEAVAMSKIFWPCTCEGQLVPILRGCRAMDAGPLVSAGPPLLACLQYIL